jgi:hypothetical protein
MTFKKSFADETRLALAMAWDVKNAVRQIPAHAMEQTSRSLATTEAESTGAPMPASTAARTFPTGPP